MCVFLHLLGFCMMFSNLVPGLYGDLKTSVQERYPGLETDGFGLKK